MNRFDPWILTALVAAMAIRLMRLADAPLWLDEMVTVQWITAPWTEMIRLVVLDSHAPLYFVLLKAWSSMAGVSPWALRLPSVVLSWAVVPVSAAIAARLAGLAAARWTAWFAALSPYLLHHAQEARMYPLVALFAAVHLYLLVRFVSGASPRLGGLFVFTAFGLVASHYYGVFLVGGAVLVLIVLRPKPLRTWVPASAASCLVCIAALLSATFLATHGRDPRAYQFGPFALPGTLWAMLSGYALLPDSADFHAQGLRAAFPFAPAAVGGAVVLCILGVAAVASLGRTARITILVPLAAALIGPFLVNLILPEAPINPRYVSAAAAPLLVLLAIGAPARSATGGRWAAAAVLGATMLGGSILHLANPGHGREDIRGADRWLEANVPLDEDILVTSFEMAALARFHWPARRFHVYPPQADVAREDNASRLVEEMPFPGRARAIYLVGRAWLSDPNEVLQQTLVRRYKQCPGTQVRGIRILCFDRPNGTAEADHAALRSAQSAHHGN